MQRISVVIPVYCNSTSLAELYRRLTMVLVECADEYELVFVDDGSTDSSWDTLVEFAHLDDCVKAIRFSRNFGQHPALCAGFKHCHGDIIVMMDADLEDHPEELPRLIEQLEHDIDIVYTTKQGQRKSLLTEFSSRLYHQTFATLTAYSVPRNFGTMRAFNRKVLDALLQHGERNVLYGTVMLSLGFRHTVLDVAHDVCKHGSSYSFRTRLTFALRSLMTYTDLPVRLLTRTGSLLSFATLTYLLAVIIQYFSVGRQVADGVTIVIVLLCLLTGVTMLSLGIIGSYVFQIYQEVLARPRYLIADAFNLTDTRPDNTMHSTALPFTRGVQEHRVNHPHSTALPLRDNHT